ERSALTGLDRTAEVERRRAVVAIEHGARGVQHFHISVDAPAIGGRGVVVLIQTEVAVGSEVQQTLHRLHVLDLVVIDLPRQLPIIEGAGDRRVEDQYAGKCRDIPQGESRPHRERASRAHGGSPRMTNPTPRTVWSSLISKGSSTFFRNRFIWTSITLSIGVCREASCQTSLASISRETTRPALSSRYSRSSNSRCVRSRRRPARVTTRLATWTSRSTSRKVWGVA